MTDLSRQVATSYNNINCNDVLPLHFSFIRRHAAPADPTVGPRVPYHRDYSRLSHRRHKSYHPYLEKNKQRVREDEARAAAEELQREQKRVDAVGPDDHESPG